MIERLLETRAALFDIAATLYGDLFVLEDKFWGSITDRQLAENTFQLTNLGYDFPQPSNEEKEQAARIAKDLDLGLDFED
jgi:hypothetical protein